MNVTYALEGCCPLPCGNGFPCGVACKCNCWGSAFAGKQCDEPWSAYWSYYQAFFVIELLFNVVLFLLVVWRIFAVSRPKGWFFIDQVCALACFDRS